MNDGCIFCKIIEGEISSEKVLESDNFIAIKDVHPKTKGHVHVIPRKEGDDFGGLSV